MVGCYDAPLTTTSYTAVQRTVALVRHTGEIDVTTTFVGGSSEYIAGVATVDGSAIYVGGSQGLKYVPYQNQRTSAVSLSASATVRGIKIAGDGNLYVAASGSPYGAARWTAPLPTTTNATLAITEKYIPGTSMTYTYLTDVHVDDATGALYTANYISSAPYGAVQKYNAPSSSTPFWSMAGTWPKDAAAFVYMNPANPGVQVTPYGFKALTGRAEGSSYVLYLVTYFSGTTYASALLRYDATLGGTGALFIAAPPANTQWVGVALAPFPPTPSNTPSSSGTPTSSATPSNTATATSSSTEGSLPSISSTPAATMTSTASVTPPASITASVSATASLTGSPSASPTYVPQFRGSPFTAGNIVTVRIGDGTNTLGTQGAIGIVQELNSDSGAIVQSFPLPSVGGYVNGTYMGSCTVSGLHT